MICDNTCTDNWQLFEQELCLWDVSVFGFRGTKITSTQIHFYIFTSRPICLHMSHLCIHSASMTQDETNSIISTQSHPPLPAECCWQPMPFLPLPMLSSSLFGSCIVHISGTTVMRPANL